MEFIQTAGGEDLSQDYAEYELHFENLTIYLSPENAVKLCKALKEHLEANGRRV